MSTLSLYPCEQRPMTRSFDRAPPYRTADFHRLIDRQLCPALCAPPFILLINLVGDHSIHGCHRSCFLRRGTNCTDYCLSFRKSIIFSIFQQFFIFAQNFPKIVFLFIIAVEIERVGQLDTLQFISRKFIPIQRNRKI